MATTSPTPEISRQWHRPRPRPVCGRIQRRNGSILWRSNPFLTEPGYYTNATPTVADGVVVAGFSASEGDPWGHGGVALLNARTGALMKISYTVPRRDWGTEQEPLYAGGGVWTAPAVDDRGYAYYGTGNPYSKKTEHQNTNAILKLDIDRSRARSAGSWARLMATLTSTSNWSKR